MDRRKVTKPITPLPDDREHYVTDNLNLVHSAIQGYFHIKPFTRGYEDMYQVGCIGLIKAATKFDHERGFAFSTYAVPLIIGECRRFKRDDLPVIKTSRKSRDNLSKIMNLQEQGYTAEEIVVELGISSAEYHEAISTYGNISTDQPIAEGEENTIGMMVASTYDVEDEMAETWLLEALDMVLQRERNRHPMWCDLYEDFICSCLYDEKPTQMELAAKYGTSQVQVSRILNRMHPLLKAQMEGKNVNDLSGGNTAETRAAV